MCEIEREGDLKRGPICRTDAKQAHVLPVTSLTEYFRDRLNAALCKQRLNVDDHTRHYVVNVLTLFARSEALFERTADGLGSNPWW